jgi:hypothetical protein
MFPSWWACDRAGIARPVPIALLTALATQAVWLLLLATGGGDLAAQDAWAQFARLHPGSAYDLAWYGGLHPVSYSILSPYVMAVLGVRATMVVATIASAGVLGHLLDRSGAGARAALPAVVGALGLAGNAVSGRTTFALGTTLGLAALTALPRDVDPPRRTRLRFAAAATLALLTTAASPVAGLFLGVAAGALWLSRRRRAALVVGLPPVAVVVASTVLFPFSGREPMHFASTVLPVLCAGVVAILVPREWTTIRRGALLYAAAVLVAWLVPSPVGTNVTRLGLVFTGVLVAAALVVAKGNRHRTTLLALGLVMSVAWQVGTVVKDTAHMRPAAAWTTELPPLLAQLRTRDADLGRVEVVPARSHREASALAPYVNLARGWNRQADVARNPLFYTRGALDADSYRAWLDRWAVQYVVLPSGEPDPAGGAAEARLVRAGLPFLSRVWSDGDWRLYRVDAPQPLVTGTARVEHFDAAALELSVSAPGDVLVRVPWSPWLALVDARGHVLDRDHGSPGCLRGSPPPAGGHDQDQWTVLHADVAGTFRIAAPYHLPRGTPCPPSAGQDS